MYIFKRTSIGFLVGAVVLCSLSSGAKADETKTVTTYSQPGYAPSVVESRTTTSSPVVVQQLSTGFGEATTVYPASSTTTTIEHSAVVPEQPQVVTIKERKKQKHLLHVGIPFSHVNVF